MKQKIIQGDEAKTSLPQVSSGKDKMESAAICPKCKGRHGYIAIIKTTVTGKWESRGISIERLQAALAKGLLIVNAKCAECGGLINNMFPLGAPPNPITQDGASASALAQDVPDQGQASQPESSLERNRIRQAIKDLHDEHYGVGHKSDLLNLDDVLAVIDDEEKGV